MKKVFISLFFIVLLLVGCTEVTAPTTQTDEAPNEQQENPTVPTDAKEMSVHFIDVGQGDAIFIRTPNNRTMLIDGGVKGAGQTVVNYLRSQNVKQLDYVVATHPDADHIGGLIAVLNSISVKHFIDSGKVHTSQTYEEMLSLIQAKNIPFTVPTTGDQITVDKAITIDVLNADEHASDNNEASIVLRLAYNDVSFLLAGDAGIAMEREIVKNFDVRSTILKAGHHGSNTSSSRTFLNSVKPEATILSYGQDNKYGHPHAEVITELQKIGSKIYGTAEAGTIVATTNGLTYTINAPEWTGVGATSSISVSPKPSTAGKVEIVSKDLLADKVVIQNNSQAAVHLQGWQLVSVEGDQRFNFPNITLQRGEQLAIVSGPDAVEAKGQLVWTKRAIWLNDGDAAKLLDAKGDVVSELE